MCLAVPARIESIHGTTALCRMEGLTKRVELTLVPDARPGDWVIVHVGFALQKIDEAKARETVALLERLKASTKDEAALSALSQRSKGG